MPYFPPLHFITFTLFELVMKEDLAKGQRIQPHLLLNNVMAEATTVFRRCTTRCAFYCAQRFGKRIFDYKLPYN